MHPSVPADMGRHAAACSGIAAVILAGGRARRMGGGDKPLLRLAGRTLLDHVLDRLVPQAGPIAINANGDPARFAGWGLPVLPDPVPGQPGPLAGVLAAMLWAAGSGAARVLTVPGDTPFLPPDLAVRLAAAAAGGAGRPALAAAAGRAHPTVAVWPVALAPALRRALGAGEARVGAFATAHGALHVAFAADGVDPFTNLNTPEDVRAAERAGRPTLA